MKAEEAIKLTQEHAENPTMDNVYYKITEAAKEGRCEAQIPSFIISDAIEQKLLRDGYKLESNSRFCTVSWAHHL